MAESAMSVQIKVLGYTFLKRSSQGLQKAIGLPVTFLAFSKTKKLTGILNVLMENEQRSSAFCKLRPTWIFKYVLRPAQTKREV